MSGPLVALIVAVAMEPIAATVHHRFGHGPGWVLHADHHRPGGRLERNDCIPAAFGLVCVGVFAAAHTVPALGWMWWPVVGVTAYGAIYGVVHDIYIHRRLPVLPRRVAWLEPLRRAHLSHHQTGGAPYGVLVPVTPADVDAVVDAIAGLLGGRGLAGRRPRA